MNGGTPRAGAPSGLFAPLAYAGYRYALSGRLLALTATASQAVTLALLTLDATGLPSGWGTLLTVQAIPQVLLMLFAGIAVDRFRAIPVLVASNIVQAAALVPLIILSAIDSQRVALWHLYVYATVSGIGAAFFAPAAQSLVPDLVPNGQIRSANALWLLALSISRFVGPPLAATVAAASGHAPALAVAVVLFAAGTMLLFPIRLAAPEHCRPRTSALRQIREGFQAARRDPALLTIIVSAAVYNFGASGATIVGLPSLAKLELGGGDQGVGILFAAQAAGALAGIAITGSVTRLPRPGVVGSLTNLGMGAALALVATVPDIWTAVPLLVAAGAFSSAGGVIFLTLTQTRAPVEMRGRVMSLLSLSLFGLTPLAYGLGGLLGDAVGARGILAAGGGVVFLTGAMLLIVRPIREIGAA